MLFYEDFAPGWEGRFGPVPLSVDSIVAFAREFDPQPFHLDEALAKNTMAGSLIASGWQSCAINMRLLADGFLRNAKAMGAPGIEEVKWLLPVRPNDRLSSTTRVLDARASKTKPSIGLVQFETEMSNQAGEPVLRQRNWILFERRELATTEKQQSSAPRSSSSRQEKMDETFAPGEKLDLGSYTFSRDAIMTFATAYDPQRFHIDEEAAKASLFGGLCASGWHTAAVWMKLMIARNVDAPDAAGLRFGPSPGFRNLKWLKPVYVDDTVTYFSQIVGLRPSASRPGWGLAFHRNSGINQRGEEVFSFEGTVFVELDSVPESLQALPRPRLEGV